MKPLPPALIMPAGLLWQLADVYRDAGYHSRFFILKIDLDFSRDELS